MSGAAVIALFLAVTNFAIWQGIFLAETCWKLHTLIYICVHFYADLACLTFSSESLLLCTANFMRLYSVVRNL